MVGKCEIGTWLLDTHTGDVYEVIKIWPDVFSDWYELVKKIDGETKKLFPHHLKTTVKQASIDSYFIKADSARILYGKN